MQENETDSMLNKLDIIGDLAFMPLCLNRESTLEAAGINGVDDKFSLAIEIGGAGLFGLISLAKGGQNLAEYSTLGYLSAKASLLGMCIIKRHLTFIFIFTCYLC